MPPPSFLTLGFFFSVFFAAVLNILSSSSLSSFVAARASFPFSKASAIFFLR